jgi:uncharacterized protein (TIGR00288 family)
MAEQSDTRVAVYIDFDNIVISQYDAVHGRGSWMKEKARNATGKTVERLQEATVNIGAVLDFASSFGPIAISRAYADWATPANTRYQKQLIDRAVDLAQLFNTAGTKNGADIRLAIDVVEDLFRLDDITHVVIVAGDSDYIPLAQRARRLGRTVIGIGVTGSTSAAFLSACDEFSYYADLVDEVDAPAPAPVAAPAAESEPPAVDPARAAAELLVRALRVARADANADGWIAASLAKEQMKRLDPSFDEKKLGFKAFTEFAKSVKGVELQEDGQARRLRLKGRG